MVSFGITKSLHVVQSADVLPSRHPRRVEAASVVNPTGRRQTFLFYLLTSRTDAGGNMDHPVSGKGGWRGRGAGERERLGPMPPPTSDNTLHYEILGVSKDVSEEELWRAWRRKAKEHHPDKGGDPKMFSALRLAFDVLKDPHKRRIYDQCIGHALPGSCDLRHGSNLLIGCGNRRRRRLKLGKDVRHVLRVSHEELQNGTTKLFSLSRNIICYTCKGKGSKSGASVLVPCPNCGGSGMQVLIEQHWRKILCCSECMGARQTIDASDKCPTCRGDGVVQERKVLEVHVEKGLADGQRITFPEEANEAPGFITGDVVFVLCLCDPEDPESSDCEVVSEEDSEEVIFVSKEDPDVDGEKPSTVH